MADDRLDDAIDAVVRAVDRIERATRVPAPESPAAGAATRGAAPAPPLADATRPIQGSVGSTGSFWAPRNDPQSTAEFSALGAATVRPYAEQGASPEVHELVGRIVGRMQSLDDHLAAAAQLRAEISELVARLAAASSPR
jgi:hypothetical protein